MTTYNTGNPIGSTDAKDLYDNAENLDYFVNGTALSYLDRLGVSRRSLAGIRASSAYEVLGPYAAGLVFTGYNQVFSYLGEFYAPGPSIVLPYTTTGVGAAEIANFRNVGDAVLREDLAGASGANFVFWSGEESGQFLEAGWFEPNDLDLTGAADESAKVLAYLNAHKRVRLPATTAGQSIKLLSLVMPSSTALTGYGAKTWDGAAWQGDGTLVVGNIRLGNSVGCTLTRMSVDNFASGGNAVSGLGPDTADHYVAQVNTRANNHGQLWEQNGTDPGGDYAGNIVLEDCVHWGGPNGFVTKMRGVTFNRCRVFGTTVQAFVITSDNINGATTYSRASDTVLRDCFASGGISAIRIYSRDQFSTSNANGVLGAKNTRIFNFRHGVLSQFVIRTGDTAGEATAGNFGRVLNADVDIDARLIGHTGAGAALYLEMVNRSRLKIFFSGNTSNVFNGDQVFGVDRRYFDSDAAFLSRDRAALVNTVNSTTLDLTWRPSVIRFQNTVSTNVGTVSGLTGCPYFEFDCVIEDQVTRLTFLSPGTYGKRGQVVSVVWDGAAFFVKGVRSIYADTETVVAASATPVLDYWANRTHSLVTFPTVSVTSITLSNAAALTTGETYTIRIGSGTGSSIAISGWSADFVFTAGIPAPTSTGTGGMILTFKAIANKLYVESRVNY